jgi:hypothetical protein
MKQNKSSKGTKKAVQPSLCKGVIIGSLSSSDSSPIDMKKRLDDYVKNLGDPFSKNLLNNDEEPLSLVVRDNDTHKVGQVRSHKVNLHFPIYDVAYTLSVSSLFQILKDSYASNPNHSVSFDYHFDK